MNTNIDYQPNRIQKKASFQLDSSYRIFHITKKQKEESDDDDDNGGQIHDLTVVKSPQKPCKTSDRHGLDGWKRKSTKNKRLLFLHKTSCESTSNDTKTPPSAGQLTNDLSPSITSNNAASTHLLKKEIKQHHQVKTTGESSFESDALVEVIDETNDDNNATLNNLLARADQLETTVKQQDFNKIQRLPRTSIQQKRKRFLIACTTVVILLTIVTAIVLFGVILILRYKIPVNHLPKSSSIDDSFR